MLIEPSATVAVSDRARAMAQQGLDVINLGGGDPDFDTPPHIRDAAVLAMQEGHTHYVSSSGIRELRQAIAEKLSRESGLDIDPLSQIVVTPGGKLGLFAAVMATVNPGDEVLILDPAWVSYVSCVQLAGGTAVRVALRSEDGFRVTETVLRDALSPRTRLLILNSPNNPTGRVLTMEELESVAEVARAHDLWVLSDEIYDSILYHGRQHISVASLPGMLDRTIIINGFSKTYAMTGWRLGYVVASAPLAAQILKVQQHSTTCAGSFTQHAGTAALRGPQDCVLRMVEEYRRRRDILAAGLNALPGVSCHLPEGTFYAFPDMSGTGMSSMEMTDKLLNEAFVAVTPGVAFGQSGEGHVRLSFATATHLIEQAIERMGAVL
jgi:aspartate aminotransferase